ncbi:acyl-CoA-binding domain-containing protein 6 [Drosophila bipectinata]|uniref:acyl-CoA-binding domain-containing protein 6 n=1 Tax=Drosophila bipectinata TaxID=42026 RepID=UPI0007E80B57|nr:acyl-CoA-binding domain-containing protein 6 [Drosophila bipectinata]
MSDSDSDPEEELFYRATQHVAGNTSSLAAADLLEFYGYYKQAIDGPCTEPSPSILHMKARNKWQAWHNLGKMTATEARRAYVQKLQKLQPDWRKKSSRNTGWVVHSIESVPLEDQRPESEKTLFDYVKENNLARLRELLTPPDIQELDEYGMALIHWATDRNAVDIIEFLVKSGASVNQRDAEQQTPLHYAASCGHVEALRCLLDLHANPTLCDSEGQTCVDVADDEQICTVLRLEKDRLQASAS